MEKREKIKEIYEKEIKPILVDAPETLEEFEKDLIETFENPDTFKIELLKVLINKIFLSLQFIVSLVKPITPDSQIISMYLTQNERTKYFEIYKEYSVRALELALEGRKKSYEEFLRELYKTYMDLRKVREEIVVKVKARFWQERQNNTTYIV